MLKVQQDNNVMTRFSYMHGHIVIKIKIICRKKDNNKKTTSNIKT